MTTVQRGLGRHQKKGLLGQGVTLALVESDSIWRKGMRHGCIGTSYALFDIVEGDTAVASCSLLN
jgi:hypothetical protein